MLPHFVLLAGQEAQIRARLTGAKQYKAGIAVLGIVTGGVGLVDLAAIQQAGGAGQASSLMAEGGQLDASSHRGIPNVLIGMD
jgi:hypothetical protein